MNNTMKNEFDEMEALVIQTTQLQQKRQDFRSAGEGEVQMKGVFKNYLVYDSALRQNVEQDAPPKKQMKPTKDGKKTYPAKLVLQTQMLNFTHVPGECEPLQQGENGWRIRAKISYNDKDTENVKQWLLDNYNSFYNGEYTGKFPIGEYINEEGLLADYKWVNLHTKTVVKVKVNDVDDSVFRQHIDGKVSNPYVVGPMTSITFNKCSAEHFVTLRKESEESNVLVPQGYTSLNAKSVQLSEDHDPSKPVTERLHYLENKDVHNMVPVTDLQAGTASRQPAFTAYFWVGHKYQSPQPCETGISVYKIAGGELKDFLSVFQDKPNPHHVIRFSVFQWKGNPGTEREMYSVKVVANEHNMWKNYGITDPYHYAHILLATHTIPCHVTASLWKEAVLKAEANNPATLNNKPELSSMRGFYVYGAKTVLPDFISFYKNGLAHRISKDRVEREFKRFSSTNEATGFKEITLKPVTDAKDNPLNGINPSAASVFALGNGQVEDPSAKRSKALYHAFDGDLSEVLDDSVFFVLTSHVMKPDEMDLVQDEKRGDALLDEFIEKEKVFYWIFGIAKKFVSVASTIVPKTTTTTNAETQPNSSSTVKRSKDQDEEEHISMEPEEPPPSSAKKTKKTTVTKKK